VKTALRDTERVTPAELVDAAAGLRSNGWRLITASCVRRPDGALTVLYHFEREEHLRHLRVELAAGERVPSLGGVYGGAFLVENEMIELQGLAVSDLAIDYGGRLYRDFDGPEGFVIEAAQDEPAPEVGRQALQTPAASPFEAAAALRLDACVPISPNGRELRASGSRVPPAEGERR
jgi:hypothetical protein